MIVAAAERRPDLLLADAACLLAASVRQAIEQEL